MQATRDFLSRMGLPDSDRYNLPNSSKRFPTEGNIVFEVPGIQNGNAMEAVLEESDRLEIRLHRITQTKGIMLLNDAEIACMVGMASKWKTELVMAVGPRATYDTSASAHTTEGQRIGYRLRGQEQIVRAIEDVKRAAGHGCRSFLVYDEGCLWILNQARTEGEIPKDC